MKTKLSYAAQIIKNRVIKGAKFLDTKMPGWYNKIDISRFNINNPCNCIIGQLYGDFWKELDIVFQQFKYTNLAAELRGFLPYSIKINQYTTIDADIVEKWLNEFWILEIDSRKTTGKAKRTKGKKNVCKVPNKHK